MSFYSTKQVARALGVSFSRLARAVWSEQIEAPEKGPGGAYLWTRADVERASWQLLGHALDEAAADRRGVVT